jgi:hypothetical protein
MMVPNDGYLIVGNSGEEQAITPLFCPPGSVLKNGNKGCIRYEAGFLKPNTEPKPVTAQEALDLAYGAFRTKVVAIGPQGWSQSVIFWRRDPTYTEYRPAPGSNH